MQATRGKNFSRQATPAILDYRYENCNFSQAEPGTRIFPGRDAPRVFIECNLVNAIPPPGSTLVRCNTSQVVFREEDGTEEVSLNERVVEIKKYRRRILGRLDPKTLKLVERERTVQADPPEGSRDAVLKRLASEKQRALDGAAAKDSEASELIDAREVER